MPRGAKPKYDGGGQRFSLYTANKVLDLLERVADRRGVSISGLANEILWRELSKEVNRTNEER